jgi:hypothetical protein
MLLLTVTLASMSIAAIMSFVAWRVASDEQRRSDARVEALAAEIHGRVPENAPSYTVTDDLELRPIAAERMNAPMFAASRPASRSRLAAVVGIGVLLFGSVAVVAMVVTTGGSAATRTRTVTSAPLELVALDQERDHDTLTITGLVRNPASGPRLENLTAVVFLFTPDGGFLTSGRAAVAAAPLAPGGESRFVVSVPDSAGVGRFRVSFRVDDHVVPHLDKRETKVESGK